MAIERLTCLGIENCIRLTNSVVDVTVSTAVGPRVLQYGVAGGKNVLGEFPENKVETELGAWRPYAGHRLWAAPEAMPFSYAPDNEPVEAQIEGDLAVRLTQPADASGIAKEMLVTLVQKGSEVVIQHKLTNARSSPLKIAPWALTVFRGGTTILPLEPFRSHDEALLPTQPLVLWAFTDLGDPRLKMKGRWIRLQAEPLSPDAQKLGLANRRGWAAHHDNSTLFVKRFPFLPGAEYPDFGCNCEIYAQDEFMEVESLGRLATLQPGAYVEHLERWELIPFLSNDDLEATLTSIRG